MAYSANKTTFSYKVENDFVEIPLLMEVPELGAAPEKIDVTTLSSPVKEYIPGIKDYGDLVFKFLYESGKSGNYQTLKTLGEAYAGDENTVAEFQLAYPDGSTHTFKAIPAVKMDAGAINGALTFSATMLLQSDIEVIPPTTTESEDDE